MSNEVTRSEKSELLKELFPVMREAGQAIMKVYNAGFSSQLKDDGSPVTLADEAAEKIILAGLKAVAPNVTIISEENAASHKLVPPSKFFLVDPLDGTREP